MGKGLSISSNAKLLGVSRTALYHFIETRRVTDSDQSG